MRLEDRGLLEARWEFAGKRPRHVYRLTAEGLRAAQDSSRIARTSLVLGKQALA